MKKNKNSSATHTARSSASRTCKLYLENGFVNIPWIIAQGMPFNFVVGGRGTGKTFGSLEYVIENNIPFIFLRRTQTDVDNMTVQQMNPFNALNRLHNWNYCIAPIKKQIFGVYESYLDDSGLMKPTGAAIAPVLSLYSIAHSRGFGGDETAITIYDEFIPERHIREMRDEGEALLNAYETLNRNREFEGREAMKLLCLSNSERLDNPIFASLGLIPIAEKMQRKKQEVYIDPKRGILLCVLQHSPISEKKKETALYKATANTAFSKMALNNEFRDVSDLCIKSVNIREYAPIVTVDGLTIFRHKNNNNYYCTFFRTGTPPEYGDTEIERKRAFKQYNYIWQAYFSARVFFENSTAEIVFNRYFG